MTYQERGDLPQENICRLVQAEELLPSSTCCIRVAVSGEVAKGDLVHIQACRIPHIGVVVGDVIDEVQDGTVGIIVENRTDHSQMLPAGLALGNWTLCDTPVEDADKEVALCASTTVLDSTELLGKLEQALPELMEGEVTRTERDGARTHLHQYQDVFALKRC